MHRRNLSPRHFEQQVHLSIEKCSTTKQYHCHSSALFSFWWWRQLRVSACRQKEVRRAQGDLCKDVSKFHKWSEYFQWTLSVCFSEGYQYASGEISDLAKERCFLSHQSSEQQKIKSLKTYRSCCHSSFDLSKEVALACFPDHTRLFSIQIWDEKRRNLWQWKNQRIFQKGQ